MPTMATRSPKSRLAKKIEKGKASVKTTRSGRAKPKSIPKSIEQAAHRARSKADALAHPPSSADKATDWPATVTHQDFGGIGEYHHLPLITTPAPPEEAQRQLEIPLERPWYRRLADWIREL